jgi:hypothetical protein
MAANGRGMVALAAALALTGCADLPFSERQEAGAPRATTTAPPPGATTAEAFDTTTAEQRAAAAAPPPARNEGGEAALGRTVASLGNPSDPGFWAETPLVSAARPGRLTDPASGRSVRVELRPSGGAPGSGTRVSLPALRVLEVPLTALPELTVTGL